MMALVPVLSPGVRSKESSLHSHCVNSQPLSKRWMIRLVLLSRCKAEEDKAAMLLVVHAGAGGERRASTEAGLN